MSDKRYDNKPKADKIDKAVETIVDADLLEAEAPDGSESPGRRGGDRESHRAGHQPRPQSRT